MLAQTAKICIVVEVNILPLESWADGPRYPFVVAGPCSAESEEQVLSAAFELSALEKVAVFRMGLWKPRTRPHDFEGVGDRGLPWVESVKSETGLAVAVEVGSARHARAALSAGVDVLWLGARTTVNPFCVQEIADALRGEDVPVLVKNPIHGDLGLWIGAVERIWRAGCRKIVAVHRGFATGEPSPYRNAPLWRIPAELKRRLPGLPLLCDPSHIAGSAALVGGLCREAMDMNMDGLMVEAHCHPTEALSDSLQQITPAQLGDILGGLRPRGEDPAEGTGELTALRHMLDGLDGKIFALLKERMDVVERIGLLKRENNLSAFQLRRMRRVVENHMAGAVELGLDREYVREIYNVIHEASLKRQSEIFNHAGTDD